jgi:hypothetical protein
VLEPQKSVDSTSLPTDPEPFEADDEPGESTLGWKLAMMSQIHPENDDNEQRNKDQGWRRHPPTQIKARDEYSTSDALCPNFCCHHSPDFPHCQLLPPPLPTPTEAPDAGRTFKVTKNLRRAPRGPGAVSEKQKTISPETSLTRSPPTKGRRIHLTGRYSAPRPCPLTSQLCTDIRILGLTPSTSVDFARWERLGEIATENTPTKRDSSEPECPLIPRLCTAIENTGLSPETNVDLVTWKNLSVLAMEIEGQGRERRDGPGNGVGEGGLTEPRIPCSAIPELCHDLESPGTSDTDGPLSTLAVQNHNTRRHVNPNGEKFGPRPAPKMPSLPCPPNAKRCITPPALEKKGEGGGKRQEGQFPEVLGEGPTIVVAGPATHEEVGEGESW